MKHDIIVANLVIADGALFLMFFFSLMGFFYTLSEDGPDNGWWPVAMFFSTCILLSGFVTTWIVIDGIAT